MAWTATLISATKVGGNVVALIRYEQNGEVIEEPTPSNTWTVASLKAWVFRRIAAFTSRDISSTNISAIVGNSVTPEDDTVAPLVTFRQRWAQLKSLKSLKPYSAGNAATLNAQLDTLQTQVENALIANPTWINEIN